MNANSNRQIDLFGQFDQQRMVEPEPVAKATRREAFVDSIPKMPHRCAAILEILGEHPEGLTRHEIAGRSGLPLQSICPVVHRLKMQNKVFERGARLTPSGSKAAIVHVAGGHA